MFNKLYNLLLSALGIWNLIAYIDSSDPKVFSLIIGIVFLWLGTVGMIAD